MWLNFHGQAVAMKIRPKKYILANQSNISVILSLCGELSHLFSKKKKFMKLPLFHHYPLQ